MTENLSVSPITLPGKNQRGTVGTPYAGVQTRTDPISGELQMRSRAVMLGYYTAAGRTQAPSAPAGGVRTGDKAQEDANACLRLTGRVKDLFKTSKGKYVSP